MQLLTTAAMATQNNVFKPDRLLIDIIRGDIHFFRELLVDPVEFRKEIMPFNKSDATLVDWDDRW